MTATTSPKTTLESLPNELKIKIIESIEDQASVARLATVSRRLHVTAMKVLYPTTSLESLPNELKIKIIESIEDQATVARLAVVSRRLHKSALEVLYTNPSLTAQHKKTGFRQLRPFTWTIIKKPHLAKLVRSFALHSWLGECCYWSRTDIAEDTSRNHVLPNAWSDTDLKNAITEYTKGERRYYAFERQIQSHEGEDATLTLLLTRLPYLRRLVLELPYDTFWLHDLLTRWSAKFQNNPHPLFDMFGGWQARPKDRMFPFLEELSIKGPRNHMHAIWIGAGLSCPSLKSIHFFGVGHKATDSLACRFPFKERSLSVAEIELRHCALLPSELAQLVRGCKTLTTFTYELRDPPLRYDHWDSAIIESIPTALKATKQDLKHLSLTFPCYWRTPEVSSTTFRPMLFAAFTNLQFLRISAVFLFGQIYPNCVASVTKQLGKALPPNLQQLQISECTYFFNSEVILAGISAFFTDTSLVGFQELRLYDWDSGSCRPDWFYEKTNIIATAVGNRGFAFWICECGFTSPFHRKWAGDSVKWWNSSEVYAGAWGHSSDKCYKWSREAGQLLKTLQPGN